VISAVESATERFDKRVEKVVDDVHDAGEEVLGRVSTETRSVGERAAPPQSASPARPPRR